MKKVYLMLAIIFIMTILVSCYPKTETSEIELKGQIIVPSYGKYEGGMLYHYRTKYNDNIYIFSGENKAGIATD